MTRRQAFPYEPHRIGVGEGGGGGGGGRMTRRQAFPYEQHCMGEGGGRIWPKERLFPCEKLIDSRGSAFCKLFPHNFGQDCKLIRRSSAISNSNRFPVVLPYLISTRIFRNPTTRSRLVD